MPCAHENYRIICTKLDGFGGFCGHFIRLEDQENRCVEQPDFRVFRESLYCFFQELQSLLRVTPCPLKLSAPGDGGGEFLPLPFVSESHHSPRKDARSRATREATCFQRGPFP